MMKADITIIFFKVKKEKSLRLKKCFDGRKPFQLLG